MNDFDARQEREKRAKMGALSVGEKMSDSRYLSFIVCLYCPAHTSPPALEDCAHELFGRREDEVFVQ